MVRLAPTRIAGDLSVSWAVTKTERDLRVFRLCVYRPYLGLASPTAKIGQISLSLQVHSLLIETTPDSTELLSAQQAELNS